MHSTGQDPDSTPADEGRIDPAVVAALYAEHAKELRYFLLGVLHDAASADDALQAAFAKAVEQGHKAREETLKGWLFRVAFNEALLLRRRQAVRDKAYRQLGWMHHAAGESPDARLDRHETVERVRKALDELPAEQRQVVHMRIYEEKTFATIAGELHVPLGTVLTRMQLALRKLRRTLDETHS